MPDWSYVAPRDSSRREHDLLEPPARYVRPGGRHLFPGRREFGDVLLGQPNRPPPMSHRRSGAMVSMGTVRRRVFASGFLPCSPLRPSTHVRYGSPQGELKGETTGYQNQNRRNSIGYELCSADCPSANISIKTITYSIRTPIHTTIMKGLDVRVCMDPTAPFRVFGPDRRPSWNLPDIRRSDASRRRKYARSQT